MRDLAHEVEVAGQRAHVVTGLRERVERIGELDRAVLLLAHEEVLELGADLELESERRRALELPAQDRARAVGPLLALHGHVAREARHGGAPRQRREAADVGDGEHVGIVRPLADVAGGEAGEARAVRQQVVDVSPPGRASRSASRACPRTARRGTRRRCCGCTRAPRPREVGAVKGGADPAPPSALVAVMAGLPLASEWRARRAQAAASARNAAEPPDIAAGRARGQCSRDPRFGDAQVWPAIHS